MTLNQLPGSALVLGQMPEHDFRGLVPVGDLHEPSWCKVEAVGSELMLHFASLGIGLAIVNGCCRLPPGLVAKPVEELPRVRYQVLQRAGSWPHAGVVDLKRRLLVNSEAWRQENDDGI